ncbi:MAG TPA: SCP2 sterol-binding domain-containing protein [Anaerolineae bacterium]|nr:SCP2 sterol-binding domain-containing protein [Anaerolineae bacterium]
MSTFRDSAQFYDCVGELMDRAKKDPKVGPKIAKSGIIIQFRYTDPEAMTTINARDKPTQADAFVDVIHGACNLRPDVTMSMKADVAHAFWHGKVNLVAALAKKEIVASGPVPKILKLVPAVEPLYKVYPALLREKGYGNLVLK